MAIPKFEYIHSMKRKDFISSILPAVVFFKAISLDMEETEKKLAIPPYLKKGDTIGITSPAGYILLENIQPAIHKINEWGFNVKK